MKDPTIISEHKFVFNPFAGPAIERVIYTTQPQAEIWIACEIGNEDANRSYNESISLILKGSLDKKALQKAVQSLVKRHEALRAVFSTDGRFMTVFENLAIKIDEQDLSTLSDSEKDNTLNDYLSSNANYIFDLTKGPLFKVGLLKLSETEHHLILNAHHIICDGWSLGIMLEELGSLYSANVKNTTANLPEPESFSKYADEQKTYLESETYRINEKFWLDQYKDMVPQVTLRTDFPRPPLRTYKSNRLDFLLDTTLVNDLKKTGIKAGCSLVTTLLTAFEVFLYTQTGQKDIVVGLPSADQAASGKTQMIGHCVNLLPLRSKIDTTMSFANHLKQRNTELFDAYEHQQLSFGQLLQKLPIARDPSRVPLVPVVFNIDMGMSSKVSFSGLDYVLKSNPRAFETFELFLNATGTEKDLILEWSYNSNLFKPETIKKMMASFTELLQTIISDPNIKIDDIAKIDDSDYVLLNNTKADYPHVPLHVLISDQAQRSPKNKALKYGTSEMTYEELDQQVNQLAHRLVQEGVKPGNVIAIALPRSIELVVCLLATIQCGASYLPLDPSYPQHRLDFMMEDSKAELLISSKNSSLSIASAPKILWLEDLFLDLSQYPATPLGIPINLDDMVYLLYTSGSTGKPKGVQVTHKNLINFLIGMMQKPGIEETDKLLSITTISFDIAMLELFLPLLKGATLVIANDETAKDSRLMLDILKNEKITILQATPTTWQMLLDAGWQNRLPLKALCGGEALPKSLATKLLGRVDELWNMYGPTETTIWSTVKQIMPDDELITIGHPIANTQLYMLDENNKLVAPGQIGELCIAGDGVAKGYWGRPELTSEKFIKNTYCTNPNSSLYKTGDLGRLLPSGEVECLGRMDHQVKIRGHRIELGEIEEALNSIEEIESSVVLVDQDRLKAFVTTKDSIPFSQHEERHWKARLKDLLPLYMVPQNIVHVQDFPTTLNGKIDRKALVGPVAIADNKPKFSAAETESERIIAAIWENCLGIDTIDINSDFFELGGHSLIAVRVMTQIEKRTGNRLPLASLLEQPTVKKLAAYLDKKYITWDCLVPLKTKGNKTPIFIVHGANHNVLLYKNLAENLDDDQPVYALQAKGLSGDVEAHDSVTDMAADYISEIQTVNPDGPYALGGFSFGGIIAFEMARQLKAEGKEVKIVALFDTYVYPHYNYTNPLAKKTVATLYNIAQLFFMGINMFSSAKNFNRRAALLKLKFEGLYLRFKYGSEKQQQMQFNRSLQVDKKTALAFYNFDLIPQDIEVTLFRCTENIYFAHDTKNLGWGKIALGGIRKHMVPGNHSEIFLSPAVEGVSKTLQNLLDNDN